MTARDDVAEQLSRTDAGLVPGAVFKTVQNARSIVQALQYLVENTPELNPPVVDVTTEYADRVPSGGMHIRTDQDIYPWVEERRKKGAYVYRRRVIVVESWTEVVL